MRLLALLAAALAAVVLPYAAPGVGVPLVALLVAATVAARGHRSPDGALFGGLALVLASMPAVLDARWVIALDLTGACVLATVAVAGPRVAAPLQPLRVLGLLPALAPSRGQGSGAVLRGAALGAFLVVPFGALFLTADAAFAEVAGMAPIPSPSQLPGRAATFALVLVGSLSLALAAGRAFSDPVLPTARLSRWEWVIPLLLLDALFAAFVVVQVTVLFGGDDHVLETAGLTYSEYARRGFWQLIAAALLTLVVAAAAARLATVRRAADRTLLEGLLGMLCALTLVVVASALHRLGLYEDAFGLTRPRLAAETLTWGIGALFGLTLVAGRSRRLRAQLHRITIGGAAVGIILFSLSNPDLRVAERNVDRWRRTGDLDVRYAQSLSADAVPALARLDEPLRTTVLAPFAHRLDVNEGWASANVSRRRARKLLGR